MKLILATVVVVGACLFFIEGLAAQETTATDNPLPIDFENFKNGRIFFNSDPCTNFIYRLLNISDAKCSVQCYIQAGLQQGGYCDENNVCQCNQIA